MRAAAKAAAAGGAVGAIALTALLAHGSGDSVDRASDKLLVELEGLTLVQYADVGGIGTCGVGHVLEPGERCPETLGEALALLARDRKKARACINHRNANRVSLNAEHSTAAIVHVFNVGCGAWQRGTPARLIDAGLLDSVPDAMARYNKAKVNGALVVVRGLVNRRAREVRVWRCEDVKVCEMARGSRA